MHRRPAVVGVAEVKTPFARIGVEYVIYAPAGNAEIRSVRTVLIGCVATYLGTDLLAERKVVAASSMRDHALSKRELALHLPGPRALWGW